MRVEKVWNHTLTLCVSSLCRADVPGALAVISYIQVSMIKGVWHESVVGLCDTVYPCVFIYGLDCANSDSFNCSIS